MVRHGMHMTIISSLLVIALHAFSPAAHGANQQDTAPRKALLHPVIFFNGLAASNLEALVDPAARRGTRCGTRIPKKWFDVYPDQYHVLDYDCVINYLLPVCESGGHACDRPQVTIRVKGFGTPGGLAFLGPLPYFLPIMAALRKAGYTNRGLRCAPYDWRFSPHDLEHRGYFDDLRELIEATYEANDGMRVSLLSHSMGCCVVLYFLNSMEKSWKERYLDRFIAISPPWAGGPAVILSMISGYNFGLPLPASLMRPIQALASSSPWLAPQPSVWGDRVIVKTANDSYTAHDLERIWSDLGNKAAIEYHRNISGITLDDLRAPGVDTWCLVGRGIPSPAGCEYRGSFIPGRNPGRPARIRYEEGDGLVPYASLIHATEAWDDETHILEYVTYRRTGHNSIMFDKRTSGKVVDIVTHGTARVDSTWLEWLNAMVKLFLGIIRL